MTVVLSYNCKFLFYCCSILEQIYNETRIIISQWMNKCFGSKPVFINKYECTLRNIVYDHTLEGKKRLSDQSFPATVFPSYMYRRINFKKDGQWIQIRISIAQNLSIHFIRCRHSFIYTAKIWMFLLDIFYNIFVVL